MEPSARYFIRKYRGRRRYRAQCTVKEIGPIDRTRPTIVSNTVRHA